MGCWHHTNASQGPEDPSPDRPLSLRPGRISRGRRGSTRRRQSVGTEKRCHPSLSRSLFTYKATADHQVSGHRLWVHEEVFYLGKVDPPICVRVEPKVAGPSVLHDGAVPEEQVEADPKHLDKQELGGHQGDISEAAHPPQSGPGSAYRTPPCRSSGRSTPPQCGLS